MINVINEVKIWSDRQKIKLHDFSEIESTNTYAKNLPWGTAEQVVIARHQKHGRGRGSNTWTDLSDGGQLLGSFVFELNSSPQPVATARVGFALWLACQHTWPEGDWSLKAPNDLLLSGKKAAGLLLEAVSQGSQHRLIVGLGLNISSAPKNVDIATSVESTIRHGEDRIAGFLDHWWQELQAALPSVTANQLSSNVCASLCQALNKNPNLKEPYLQVHSDGSLQTAQGRIDWMSL